ncbi:MAG: TVP38/TMEM64 family protein [Bacilli bacterium]|nr:TVP38/TMEM64 family protein [Bacilli bacterium]
MKDLDILLTNLLMSIGVWGYILSCLCIIIESIIPILPLSVFITLLFYKFGVFIGFIISYIFTIIGCIVSYNIFNSKLRIKLDNYIIRKDSKNLDKIVKNIRNVKFVNLSLLIALPFTPAFLINIACGLANVSKKKYFLALVIGKVFLVIFWGLVGTSVITSIKNPINLIYIGLLLILCFLISRFVSKKEGIE